MLKLIGDQLCLMYHSSHESRHTRRHRQMLKLASLGANIPSDGESVKMEQFLKQSNVRVSDVYSRISRVKIKWGPRTDTASVAHLSVGFFLG